MTDPETPIVPEVDVDLTPAELEQYLTLESRRGLDAHTLYVGRGWCPAVDEFGSWCGLPANHAGIKHRAPVLNPDQTVTWITW